MILSSGAGAEERGMAAAEPLRSDFDAEAVRALAKRSGSDPSPADLVGDRRGRF